MLTWPKEKKFELVHKAGIKKGGLEKLSQMEVHPIIDRIFSLNEGGIVEFLQAYDKNKLTKIWFEEVDKEK